MLPVVLVDVGVFQPYIIDNIKNLILFGNTNIHVITDKEFFSHFENLGVILIDQADFPDTYSGKSTLDKDFRGGFWQHCSRRFFLINDWMKKNNITNCVHVENDVPSYINFEKVFGQMDHNKFWGPMNCGWYCVPSILFINRLVLDIMIQNFNFHKNDMENLAALFYTNRQNFASLPIFYNQVPNHPPFYSENFNGIIFDANAIGQYLGGVDPRNTPGDTRGFINESCVVQNYHHHQFFWVQKEGLYAPHIAVGNTLIPIANLHIHSKNVYLFMADNPLETKLIKKYN